MFLVWGYILNNPNTRIEKPKIRRKEIECYSPEEVNQLIEVIKDEPLKYKAIIMLALDSGAKRREITGLTWQDIDFKKSTMLINKSTQYTKDLGIFEKETKTPTRNRIIYLSKATITHNTYSHFFDNEFKEVAHTMDNFLRIKSI